MATTGIPTMASLAAMDRQRVSVTGPQRPARRWRVLAAASLAGLLAVATAWNLTRSGALDDARRAYALGDLPHSLQRALDHLDRRPWSRDAVLLAARCLSRLDYAEAAEPYYRRAGDLGLNDQQVRAYGLVRGNHRERAAKAYDEILKRWPDNITALRRLAAVELSRQNVPVLLSLSERLEEAPGGAAMGATLRGVVAHNDKAYEEAVRSFERVLEIDPELREMPLPKELFWNHFAVDLLACGRSDDVISHLSRVLETSRDVRLMSLLGSAYVQQGRAEDAERCFREVIEWQPRDYHARVNLGKLDLQRRRLDTAVSHLEKARTLTSRPADALYSLVVTYKLLGRPAEAAEAELALQALRDRPAKAHRSSSDPWPAYAL